MSGMPSGHAGVSRRSFGVGTFASVAGLSLRRASAAEPFTIVQPNDLQPRDLFPTRNGNFSWVRNVFECLVYLDPVSFDPKPWLARSWTLSSDGLSLQLALEQGVTFHSGRKLTADDVKFSIETAALPETAAQLGFVARQIASVQAQGDSGIALTFKQPLPNVFELLARTPIVDRETYQQRIDGSRVIGTGPYRFAAWTPGALARLVPYPGYRDAKATALGTIEVAVIPDATAMISALRSSRAQMAISIQPQDAIEFSGNPMFKTANAGGSIYPFGVDVKTAPFDRKEMRQALGFAVDRQRINQQLFDGTGTPTSLFWQPGSPGYSQVLADQYKYDPDKARQLIKDAKGQGAKLTITLHALPSQRSIFEVVQNNLNEVGLQVSANVIDVPSFDKQQVAGDLGPGFLLLHGLVGLSATTLMQAAPAIREGNPSHFWTDDYVALRNAVQAARNKADSATAVEALGRYMNDQAFDLALLQAPGLMVVSSDLAGARYGQDGYIWLGNASRS